MASLSENMNENSYRVGIIGLGRIAYLMEEDPLRPKPCTHAGAWQAHGQTAVVAACDTSPQRREAFRARFPGARLYADYEEMLAREALDIVSIAAYATERCDMVVAAAEAGVKGIWCEKAMASSLAEARRMSEALSRSGTQMVVSYMRRWDGRCRAVKKLLDEGAIGRLESINLHFSGNMLHTGTHAFDLVRMFAGEAATVQAWLQGEGARPEQSGYRFGGEIIDQDAGGFALIELENGVRVAVHGGDKRYFRFELELLGEEGMIRVGNTQAELWRGEASSNFVGFKELKRQPLEVAPTESAWWLAAADLLQAVATGERVACGVEDGRQALAIGLAMHESHAKAGKAVSIRHVDAALRVASR